MDYLDYFGFDPPTVRTVFRLAETAQGMSAYYLFPSSQEIR